MDTDVTLYPNMLNWIWDRKFSDFSANKIRLEIAQHTYQRIYDVDVLC